MIRDNLALFYRFYQRPRGSIAYLDNRIAISIVYPPMASYPLLVSYNSEG